MLLQNLRLPILCRYIVQEYHDIIILFIHVFAFMNAAGKSGPECKHCKADPDAECRFCSCCVCGGKQDAHMQLLCDECNMAFHIYCLNPPLATIPDDEDWWERAPLDILLRDFEPRSHLTRKKGWWVLFKCGLKCISVVIKRWLRVKSIYSNETMRSQVGVNLIFERLSAKQISTPSWHHFLKRRKASLSCVLGSVCFSHSIATKSERLLEKQFRYWLYLVRREDNTNGFENKHFKFFVSVGI